MIYMVLMGSLLTVLSVIYGYILFHKFISITEHGDKEGHSVLPMMSSQVRTVQRIFSDINLLLLLLVTSG